MTSATATTKESKMDSSEQAPDPIPTPTPLVSSVMGPTAITAILSADGKIDVKVSTKRLLFPGLLQSIIDEIRREVGYSNFEVRNPGLTHPRRNK